MTVQAVGTRRPISAEDMFKLRWLSHPRLSPDGERAAVTVTWLDRAVMGVVAIGIAPVGEELLFRGILYPAIRQAGFPGVALWGTSLLFAAIHVNLGIFVPLLLLALVLAQLYERTGNLLASFAAHVLFNAFNFVRFFYLEAHFT